MSFFKRLDINTLLLAAVIVLVLVELRCGGHKDVSQDYLNTIKSKDDSIKLVVNEMAGLRVQIDSAVTELNKTISENKSQFKETVIRYEKIPVYIRSLNKDSLRAAAIGQ